MQSRKEKFKISTSYFENTKICLYYYGLNALFSAMFTWTEAVENPELKK